MTVADAWRDADVVLDESACPICHSEMCEDPVHIAAVRSEPTPEQSTSPRGLDPAFLADAVDVIREGQQIAEQGIRYTVDGLVPAYGMLGILVAFAKVGKTTLGQALAAAVAMGRPFLDRATMQTRVLVIAAEDPPEYTAFLARVLCVDPMRLTFYRAPIQLDAEGLASIAHEIQAGRYGLVLIASWQAVVSSLVRDENDNAGAVRVVGQVKAATHRTQIPWLIDAHSGKAEDQADDADPSRAMRGASSAAGCADYALSLRYANGTFGTQRRLSGKGRFVNFAPIVLDYAPATGLYTCVGDTKRGAVETTWRLICETGALAAQPRSLADIARTAGLVSDGVKISGAIRSRVAAALTGRDGIVRTSTTRRGQPTTCYHQLGDAP